MSKPRTRDEHIEQARQLKGIEAKDHGQLQRPKVVHAKRAPFDVYIGRPGRWGNPFKIGPDGTRGEVIAKYRDWLLSRPADVNDARLLLRGKVLGCYCAPWPCHGDVLMEIANG